VPSLLTIRFPNGDLQHRIAGEDIAPGSTIIVGGALWRVVTFDDELRSCRVEPAQPPSFQWYEGVPSRAAGRRG
jgi:hypothetical protein